MNCGNRDKVNNNLKSKFAMVLELEGRRALKDEVVRCCYCRYRHPGGENLGNIFERGAQDF